MSTYGYRRGSIFWALTLIAVGGLFLYQNFNPNVHPWHIIAKFWPVLIIFWGVAKLAEYIQAHAHPDRVPPPLFAASEVVLLILILVFGTVVSKIVLHSWNGNWGPGIHVGDEDWDSLFMNTYSYTQTVSQQVKAQPHLLLVVRRGDVEMRGADQQTMDAVVKESIRAEDEAAAKKLSDQLKFQLVEQGGQYELKSNLDSLPESGRNVRLDMTLHVPRSTAAEITTEHGDAIVDGLKADQTLDVNRGDVHVTNAEGLVRIHKSGGSTEVRDVKGNVELDGRCQDIRVARVSGTVTVNGEFPGTVEFQDVTQTLHFTSSRTDLTAQKLSGRLDMEVGSLDATGVDGSFEITTKAKDISLDGFKNAVHIIDTNGDINLAAAAAPTHPIEVDSKKGDVTLALPASSNFDIDAVSHHGQVDSDFSAPSLKVVTEGDEPSIKGTVGKGGPTIKIETAYGTIHVVRGTGPRPPAPPTPPAGPKLRTSLGPHYYYLPPVPRRHHLSHAATLSARVKMPAAN